MKNARNKRRAAGGDPQGVVDRFNREFPVGAACWYWQSLPFGPVRETRIRRAAAVIADGNSNAGLPVAFVEGVAGYVSIFHISEPREHQRPHVQFVTETGRRDNAGAL